MQRFITKKALIILTIVLVAAGMGAYLYAKKASDRDGGNDGQKVSTQSHPTYRLNFMNMAGPSGIYEINKDSELTFDIRDQDNKVLKEFDKAHEKQMHLIVVRKDRTNFQHVHPKFNKDSGLFAVTDFRFPTDGEYRVFADFTPSTSQMDVTGAKLPVTLFTDVKAGDIARYTPVTYGADITASNTNGFMTDIVLVNDDSPGASLIAGIPQLLGININKNGRPYKNLQLYLGALGHMVVIGPNLEFIHAHTMSDDVNNQSGLIPFSVTFPDASQYRLFLQTQADDRVMTTDYTLTVKENPNGPMPSTQDATPHTMDNM